MKVLQRQTETKEATTSIKLEVEDYHLSGILFCNGISTARNIKDAFCFVWFLSVASAYRDMIKEQVFNNFNINNHSSSSFWLMGCCGPFGVIDINLPGKTVYSILKLNNKL